MNDDLSMTDPSSAAWLYRRALEEILSAPSLGAAQKRAREALKTQVAAPGRGHVTVVGGYGLKTQQPFVSLTVPRNVTQLPVDQAREIAQHLLDQASTAEQDGMLFTFLGQQLGFDLPSIAGLIGQLRAYRARFRSDLKGLGLADNEEPPDAPPTA